MNILICGGRDYEDYARFCLSMWAIRRQLKSLSGATIIHGACPTGADKYADNWAKEHKFKVKAYPAAWNIHGRGAGPIRNSHMLQDGKPDVVIAFPGGRGTADMVAKAEKVGIRVIRAGT